jgi:F-type H+-transporting ATPase subunit epsilon
MHLDIITPDTTLYSGEVNLIQLPGKDGSFEILNQHAPLIAVLKAGTLRIVDKSKEEHLFTIQGGVVEVLSNKVLILSE